MRRSLRGRLFLTSHPVHLINRRWGVLHPEHPPAISEAPLASTPPLQARRRRTLGPGTPPGNRSGQTNPLFALDTEQAPLLEVTSRDVFSNSPGLWGEEDSVSSGPSRPEDGPDSGSSLRLLLRARNGDREALDQLFGRLLPSLKRWTRGRFPRWARDGMGTTDVVQDAALNVLKRLGSFEPRRRGGLRAYLRQAVQNRIRDLIRHRVRRGGAPEDVSELAIPSRESPWSDLVSRDEAERYLDGLSRLSSEDQVLIVGRIDLGYDYDQLALVSGRSGPDAARMAVRRAIERLAREMDV